MGLGFLKKESKVGVVIITASCCIPGVAPFEEQAQRIVEQAISESGVAAQLKIMPGSSAYFGGAPREVMTKLLIDFNQGKMSIPAILIDGKAAFYGVPKIEDMKAALLQAAATNNLV